MPRRSRPAETTRSEHWLREAVNRFTRHFNNKVAAAFNFDERDGILWLSPTKADDYAEYCDQAFLDRLDVRPRVPLKDFWPPGGPCWDGLARTNSDKRILVEAKAYIEEAVDYRSRACPESLEQIKGSLAKAKTAFNASKDAPWESPLYQCTNRLAHLYYLHGMNDIDAYLLFVYFAGAADVPSPASAEEWKGGIRLMKKCLGLGRNPYQARVADLIVSVPEMLASPITL